MSYIYEALKRAEDENAKGVAAPRPVGRPAFFAARPRWWLWALIGLLGANAAVLVTLVLARGSRSPDVTMATTRSTEPVAGPLLSPPPGDDTTRMTPPAQPAGPPAPPAVATAPPAAVPPASTVAPAPPIARPAPPAPPPVAPAVRSTRSAAAPSTAPAPPSERPVPPSPPVAERPTAPVTPSVPRIDPPPPASTPSAVARPVSPPTAAPAAPVSPSGSVAVPAAKTPTVEGTAPPAVETPKLQIQAVVYSDVPAQRMVFIDGRRYAEGDKIDAETVVERITPEGAVVTRRGQRFALTSGRP
jgi:hypothetical protein